MRPLALALVASLSLAPLASFAQEQSPPSSESAARPDNPDEPGRAPRETRGQGRHSSMAATANPDEPGRGDRETREDLTGRSVRARYDKVTDADIATAPVFEQAHSTHHSVTIGGRVVPYTATAGTLTLRDDEGKPIASMFYVAYVADHGPGPSRRPVTFFYNGGPGSSSMWLHMGSMGPVRVRTDSPLSTHNAPFDIGPNNDSILDRTDMVFLDAIGAGYSRPLGDAKGSQFWGVDQDIDAFARGIQRYITLTNRWNSPKYLFGESYGTTRSAGLVYALQQRGIQMNGVMLLSSILNYGIRDAGFDQNYINYLPSYASAAWYHNRIPNRPADLPAFLAQVREFARGPYAAALAKGQDLPPAEAQAIARQLSAFTGISPQYWLEANLRVDLNRFRSELLRDQRRIIGRYDSRFLGIPSDAAGENAEYDPSDTGITGAFVAAFHYYLTNELGYRSDLQYRPTYYAVGPTWDWHHRAPGARFPSTTADVAIDLAAAMRQNPHLRVYSLNGWYDMATPFFGTEYDLAHMELDPSIRPNLRFAYYPSGHMVYLNPEALVKLKADVARFYDEAEGR